MLRQREQAVKPARHVDVVRDCIKTSNPIHTFLFELGASLSGGDYGSRT
jgi:hypothetical protein